MQQPDWLPEAQWNAIMDFIATAIRDGVIKQADACRRQVIRNHQQPPVTFEEVRNAVLLI